MHAWLHVPEGCFEWTGFYSGTRAWLSWAAQRDVVTQSLSLEEVFADDDLSSPTTDRSWIYLQ